MNSKLDQLKIEREPERERSGPGPGRWLLLAALLLALGAAGWWFLRPAPAPELRTTTVRAVSGTAAGTVLNATGYVTARRQATVSSKFTAQVLEVMIEEGMKVKQGDVLARLDDVNIRKSYNLADAQLQAARTTRKETEALLTEARANHARTLELVDRQLASAAELDRARAAMDSLAARLERMQAEVTVAERQLDIIDQQLEDSIIRAPFDGVIVAKNAQPGEMISPVSAGGGFTRTGIGTIVDMGSLEIEIDVNETYINRVSEGQSVVATLDAYPDWQIPAYVIAIIPTADRQRATVEVRVGFNVTDPRILPDMGVKVAFQDDVPAERSAGGVLVPEAAISGSDTQAVVWVVSEGRAERRAVTIGARRGSEVVVVSGLQGGERLALNAPAGLTDGAAVREAN
jgi:RND family efflux transporter MFP subunit